MQLLGSELLCYRFKEALLYELIDEYPYIKYFNKSLLSNCMDNIYRQTGKSFVIREMPTGKGFADMIFIPREFCRELPVLVVELKWNHYAKTAIAQIKNKDYMESIREYKGNILLVGINYSKRTKKHTCKIEQA